MNERLGPVDIEFVLKNVNFKQEAGKIKAEISGISQTAAREVSQTNDLMRSLGRGVAAYFSFQALQGFGQQLISVRGEFENLQIAFETMLGSKAKADKLMADVTRLAATTPFSLTEVSQGVKQLLAYQESQETVIETTTRLGNISAGLSVPIGRLIMAYGQVRAKGKLMGDDLRQFTEAGVPMIAELAKHFGVAESEISKMVETGRVGFADVQGVIRNLTDEGGMFFNLMEKQSKSLTGMVSNLGDAWDRMLNDIGQGNEGVLKDGISILTSMVENYETILNILKVIAVTYGSYKAAVIAVSVIEKVRYQITLAQMASTKGLTTLEALHAVVLGKVKDAQALLNKTILKNHYAAAAALIAGLVSALIIFRNKASAAEVAQQKINDAAAKANDSVAEEQSKIKILVDTLNNENASRAEKEKAIRDLNAISPEYLGNLTAENIATEEGKRLIDAYIEALRRKIEAQELEREMAESIRRVNAAQRGDVEGDFGMKLRQSFLLQLGMYKKVADDATEIIGDIISQEKELQEKISARIQELTTTKGGGGDGGVKDTVKSIKDLKAELTELQRRREELTDVGDKKELDRLAKLIIAKQEEIEKFKIETAKDDKRSDLEIFEDDIKKKKELYAQYEAYKRVVGEEEANQMYANLRSQGEDYLAYLNGLLNTLPAGQKKAVVVSEIASTDKGKGEETVSLDDILRRTATFNQQLIALEKKYQDEKKILEKEGASENLRILTDQYEAEQQALIESNQLKSESYAWVYAEIDRMSRAALKEYISNLKKEVQAKAWSDEAKLMLSEKLAQAEQKLRDQLPETLQDVSSVLKDAANLAGEFDEELANAISTASDLASAAASIATGLASGNVFQAVGGLLQAVTSIVKFAKGLDQSEKKTQELIEVINRMNEAIQRQAHLIDMLNGVEKYDAFSKVLKEVEKSLSEVERKMQALGRSFQSMVNQVGEGALYEEMKKLGLLEKDVAAWDAQDWINVIENSSGEGRKKLEALYEQWLELQQAQEDYYLQQAEYATGMSFDGFVDEFLEALKAGERSTEDFADNVEDMLRNAIIQGFKTQYLMEALEPFYRQFAEFSEGGLTEEEILMLRERLQAIFGDAADAFDALADMGVDLTGVGDSANSLAGAIQGITEETASILAGRLNSMHLTMNASLQIAQRSVLHQAEIAGNTRELFAMKSLLQDIKSSLSGDNQSLKTKRAGGF